MKAVLRNIGVVGLMLTCACGLARSGSDKNVGRGGAVLSEVDFKKLDTFEGVLLSKADKVFVAKDFRRAAAEYEAFILQYPKSVAVPYALLRKGRSLHSDGKRFEAIKVYNEVLDYFPNAIEYAGAALYLIGECHWENGDVKEAMKSWAEMAKDADYRKLALAAGAINRLADNLVRQEKWPEAVTYYQQVVADFRRSNGEAAGYAMDRVIFHCVRVQPDVTKLRAAYDKFQTFESQPGQGDEVNFWSRTMGAIDRFGAFAETEKSDNNAYYQYWSKAMDGKQPAWDDFQLTLARYQMVYEGDAVKWMGRVDTQYTKFQKAGDYSRTIRWIGLYTGHKGKIDEYYSKLSFDKMTNSQIEALIRLLYDSGNELAMAHNTVGKLKADLMTDDEREKLAMFIGKRDEPAVEMLCYAMKDPDRGKMVLLRYYSGTRQTDKGLKLSDALVNVPAYAKETYMIRGGLFQSKKQWVEAIGAYRLADDPPMTLFKIVDCLLADGKRDAAIEQLREIENFFKNAAPEAGLKVAFVYRDAGDRKQYISNLRNVLKKYAGSGQSSTAHLALEGMGIKTGGGLDAE